MKWRIRHESLLFIDGKAYFIKSLMKRVVYMKEKGIFHSVGERAMSIFRKILLCA